VEEMPNFGRRGEPGGLHYAKGVKARQDRLDFLVVRTWNA